MTKETKWSIDLTHSENTFKVRHLMIAYVKGGFKTFDANIYTTGKDFTTAEIDLWIDASSLNTGDEKRDEHLRGEDFFDMLNHKQISFVSNTIENADQEGNHEMWGELTIKGITKNIKLSVQFGGMINDPWGNEKAGFTVTGKISRTDWGLTWNSSIAAGGFMLGDDIAISCELELTNMGERDLTLELEPSDSRKGSI